MQFKKCLNLCILLVALAAVANSEPNNDLKNFLPEMDDFDLELYDDGPEIRFYSDEPMEGSRKRRSIPNVPLRYRANSGSYGFVKCKLYQWKTPTSCRFVRTGR